MYKITYNVLSLYSKSKCLKFPLAVCGLKKQNLWYKNYVRPIGVSTALQHPIETEPAIKEGLFTRIKTKLRLKFIVHDKILEPSMYIYEACVDKVDCAAFINRFELPDTFLTWFLVTELHVWMCLVRGMREGEEGKLQRDQIIKFMWKDVPERMSKLGYVKTKQKQAGLKLMNEQFRAAICAYDEGLNSSDKVLAAAIWRTLFSYDCSDPYYLEVLVHYIRKHVNDLDQIDRTAYLYGGQIEWKPLDYFLKMPTV